jgi:hypothetical protein
MAIRSFARPPPRPRSLRPDLNSILTATMTTERFTRRRYLVEPARVRELRGRLGVSGRTVIRGEQRWLEIPWRPDSMRVDVYQRWCGLAKRAADTPIAGSGDRLLSITARQRAIATIQH